MIQMRYNHLSYPNNLIADVFGDPDAARSNLSDIQKLEGVNVALSTLEEVEQQVIRLYYHQFKTMREIGAKLQIAQQHVQQIRNKALRKLRSPFCSRNIKYGVEGYKLYLQEWQRELAEEAQKQQREQSAPIPERHVEYFDLSCRAMNCLHRAGLHTAEDVALFGADNLLTLRNSGVKTQAEIVEKIIKPYEAYRRNANNASRN